MDNNNDPTITEYLNTLNEIEIKTLKIAQDHLGSSFNIKKSIGFINWKNKLEKSLFTIISFICLSIPPMKMFYCKLFLT